MCVSPNTYMCMHACKCTCACVHTFVRLNLYAFGYMSLCVCLCMIANMHYVHMYLLYTCMHVTNQCMHTYEHKHQVSHYHTAYTSDIYRVILSSSLLTHQVVLRSAVQCFFLETALHLVDLQSVGYDDVAMFFGSLKSSECLAFGSSSWKTVSNTITLCYVRTLVLYLSVSNVHGVSVV